MHFINMNYSPSSIRALKIIVSVFGILIIVGVIAIISTIIYRMSTNDFSIRPNVPEFNINLNIPSDSVIKSINSDENTLTIFYKVDQDHFLKTIDLLSGNLIRLIKVNL
tara:strand:- start:4557 stop:4883 length:327 start_codon:yes stop_codon:yes gene_type:complete